MSNWVSLHSGRRFYFEEPNREPLRIVDIAYGLSNTCRFGGQCHRYYSVAEHSVRASLIVPPEFAREALLHDMAESVLGDIPRPLKALLPDYRGIELNVEWWLRLQYDLAPEMPLTVHNADMIMLATERELLLPSSVGSDGWECLAGYAPLPGGLGIDYGWTPDRAVQLFMSRYAEITQ